MLAGDWTAVAEICPVVAQEDTVALAELLFLAHEQSFLELLAAREKLAALRCLQSKLTGAAAGARKDPAVVQALGALLLRGDEADLALQHAGGWPGVPLAREALWRRMAAHVSPALMVPPGRLEHLLCRGAQSQVDQCVFHVAGAAGAAAVSLLVDHRCPAAVLPRQTSAELRGHTDEVWFVRFSHSGHLLASASKDNSAIVWDTATAQRRYTLCRHHAAVCYLAWSPDDTLLVTCGVDTDHQAVLWDMSTGEAIESFEHHTAEVSCAAWHPAGRHFVTGSTDRSVVLFAAPPSAPTRFAEVGRIGGVRPVEMHMTPDGRYLVAACHDHKLHR